jgi:hypothetical protein
MLGMQSQGVWPWRANSEVCIKAESLVPLKDYTKLVRGCGQHVNNTKVWIKDSTTHQNFVEAKEKGFKAMVESNDHIHVRNIQFYFLKTTLFHMLWWKFVPNSNGYEGNNRADTNDGSIFFYKDQSASTSNNP